MTSLRDLLRVPRRPTALDLAVAGGFLVWAALEALLLGGPYAWWVRLLVAAGYALPLAIRRQAPLLALGTILAVLLVAAMPADDPSPGTMPMPAILLAVFSVGLHERRPALSIAGAAAALGAFLITVWTPYWDAGPEPSDLVIAAFFVAGAWGAGFAVRRRALQAERAAREGQQGAAAAVAEERARIARELHDVVAHSISIVTVQAGAAEALIDHDPAEARRHLAAVRTTAHEALVEMRRLLGVLRQDEAVYQPQPTLERVPALVEDARAAGLPVVLREEGARNGVPAGVELAAYRIVQEGLTNVRTHAGDVPTTVTLRYAPDCLRVEILNEEGEERAGSGSGLGLVGVRERARVFGGEIEAGPRGEGGFALRARLPLEGGA